MSNPNTVNLNQIASCIDSKHSFDCWTNNSEGHIVGDGEEMRYAIRIYPDGDRRHDPLTVATWNYHRKVKTVMYEREAVKAGGLAAVHLVWICQDYLEDSPTDPPLVS